MSDEFDKQKWLEDLTKDLDPDQPVLTFGMGEQDLETITVRDLRGTEN